MFQDLRYGLRMLLKKPGFTLVAVLSLALGIGANTAIFSLLDVVLLKSLPVRQPERLVLFGKGESMGLTNGFPNGSWDLFSYPFYREAQQHNEIFSDVAALLSMTWNVHGSVNTNGARGDTEKIVAQLVSGTYFSTLGVNASIGRVFTDADDQNPGGHPIAVVSHGFWEQRLGGDTESLGKTITIDQVAYTIIGVAPRDFFGTTVGQAPDIFVPLAMGEQFPPAHWNGRNERLFQPLNIIARLRDGVSPEQAGAAVNLRFKQFLLEEAGSQPAPDVMQKIEQASIELTPAGRGLSELRQEFSLSLRILMAVVGVVLLIACANVANLLLARAAARQKEFAIRLALGAGRIRLVRQLLTESVLLAALGGISGVFLAWWGSRMLVLMVSTGTEPLPLDVSPNARVLGFTLFASLLSALVFGTAPALRAARMEAFTALKGGRGTAQATSQSPLGRALVVAQVSLSLLLLVGAGLFVRTLVNLQNVPTGFNRQNALKFQIDTSVTGYKENQLASLMREVEEKVEAVPGVEAASFSFFIFNQGAWTTPAFTRERPTFEGRNQVVKNNTVGPDYFTAMGIPLVLGRSFGPQDTLNSQKVAVISETMVERFFPDQSPLGRRFGINGPESIEEIEIIGVVKDAKTLSLTEVPQPMAYYPHAQGSGYLSNFVVRFSGPSPAIISQIRESIQEVNRNLPIDEVVTLSEQVDRSLVQQRLVAWLASFFGLLALLLVCVGLYGTLSYAVARRTNEIGIRMALGAQRGSVIWLIFREAMVMMLIGIGIGLLAASPVTKMADSLLFGLKPTDPMTLISAILLLIVVAALAGYLPAHRATKVDPLVALRHE